MPKAIYVNLSVADLSRSMNFFYALGFSFNPQFSNQQVAALIITDNVHAMLHTPESFLRFTDKQPVDASKSTEVMLALQMDSRVEVDQLLDKVASSGGCEIRQAADHGFMYERAFEDPDGHIWEVFWMDIAQ